MASTLLLRPLNPDYIKQEKCNSTIYLLFIVLPHGLLKTRLKVSVNKNFSTLLDFVFLGFLA